MPYDDFPELEVLFFNKIKKYIDVVFDVGSRDDIDYIINSKDRPREFHLFEPVEEFIENSKKQLASQIENKNKVYLNAFGIGSKESTAVYYPNTQSFVFRYNSVQSKDEGIRLKIKTLDGYCKENNIKSIDFLKIDIEGMEIDCFEGGKSIIENNTKIIQFEHGGTLLDRGITPEEYIGWFDKNIFDIYLQNLNYHNEGQLLIKVDDAIFKNIKSKINSTLNLVAIRKEYSQKIYDECIV
jgi:FkbM family methyltransferase